MSLKVLRKGSTCPARVNEDVVRIYSMRFCPYAQRVRLVLRVKGIPHEEVNVHIYDKPEWFLEKNPLGKVPALEWKDKIIYESLVCAEFLEDMYPDTGAKLIPADPYEKASQKLLMERFEKVTAGFYSAIRAEDPESVIPQIYDALDYFENYLSTPYFGGNTVRMVDLTMWPWWERMGAVELLSSKFNFEKFPKLKQYFEKMRALDAIKSTEQPAIHHLNSYRARLRGDEFDFDTGL